MIYSIIIQQMELDTNIIIGKRVTIFDGIVYQVMINELLPDTLSVVGLMTKQTKQDLRRTSTIIHMDIWFRILGFRNNC